MNLESLLQRLRPGRAGSPARQRVLLVVALVAFVAMTAIAIINFPDDLDPNPRWWLLAIVAVFGPLITVTLNGLEYVQQGRLVGRRIALRDAVRVSVLGTAANLAPVPGSVIVRTSALAADEVGVKRAAATTATVGLGWLGASALAAGVLQPFADRVALGLLLVVAGLVLLGTTFVLVRRAVPGDGAGGVFGAIVLVELGTVVVGALRLTGFVYGLGLDSTASQAVGLTLAGVIASATGVFPAGLGIREGLIALASPVLDLPVAVGLVAAAADRIAGLAMLAILTTVLVARRDRPSTSPHRS